MLPVPPPVLPVPSTEIFVTSALISLSVTPIVALSYQPSFDVDNIIFLYCPTPAAGTVRVVLPPLTLGAEGEEANVIVIVIVP